MSCVICKSVRFRWADFTRCLCRCLIDIRSKLKRPVCCRCSRFCSAICRSRGDRRPRMTRQTQPRQHVITRHQFCPDMAILRVGNPSSSPPGNLSVFENNRKNVEKNWKRKHGVGESWTRDLRYEEHPRLYHWATTPWLFMTRFTDYKYMLT